MKLSSKLAFGAFLLILVAQFLVVSHTIIKQEDVLSEGEEMKFKTIIYDPHDLFRGKYVYLNLEAAEVKYRKGDYPKLDEEIIEFLNSKNNKQLVLYFRNSQIQKEKVYFFADDEGFAVASFEPKKGSEKTYLMLEPLRYSIESGKLYFKLPFNKFFANETDAPAIEKRQIELNRDGIESQIAVSIKKGIYSVKELYLNKIPYKEYLKMYEEKNASQELPKQTK